MNQQEYEQRYVDALNSGIRNLNLISVFELTRGEASTTRYNKVRTELTSIQLEMEQKGFSTAFLCTRDVLTLTSRLTDIASYNNSRVRKEALA